MILFECVRLSAKISKRQCGINRQGGHISCQGCAGLGKSAQVSLPDPEEKKVPKYRCNKTGCDRAVKSERDFCWQHKGLADQVESGLVEGSQAGQSAMMGDDTENLSHAPHVPAEEIFEDELLRPRVIVGAADASIGEAEGATEIVHVTKSAAPQSGLAGLLRMPPPAPIGMLIPFTEVELSVLAEREVSGEEVRRLVLMGLAGELVRGEAA